MNQTFLFFLILGCAAAQFFFLLNHRYLLRGTLFSAISGVLCLWLISSVGLRCGIILPITVPTLAVSGTLGIPGCVFLLFSKFICGI